MKLRQPVYTDGEEPLTKEEVDSALRDAGYDPEAVGKKMDTVAQQALKITQLEAKNKQLRRLAWRVFMGHMNWQEYFEAIEGEQGG